MQDVTTMSAYSLETYSNTEVIAVDQGACPPPSPPAPNTTHCCRDAR